MMAPAPDTALLLAWVAFAGVAIVGIVAVLVWAVRTGQFADQDRARYLPLESGIPEGPPEAARVAGVLPASGGGILPPQSCRSSVGSPAETAATGSPQAGQGGPDDVQP